MEAYKPAETLMSTSAKMDADDKDKSVDIKKYRGMIGSLLYLTASRPNIIFSVYLCAHFQWNTKESHLSVVKRIFRYLSNLRFPKDTHMDLISYTDADFVGCKIDRKSTSGSCYFLGSSLVSWSSKK